VLPLCSISGRVQHVGLSVYLLLLDCSALRDTEQPQAARSVHAPVDHERQLLIPRLVASKFRSHAVSSDSGSLHI
jgi:hypothetical protein